MTNYFCASTGDNSDGLTWAKAYTTPAAAVAAVTGGAGHNIFFKAETFVLSAILDVSKSLNMYGGWVGNETESGLVPGDRPEDGRTLLDADSNNYYVEFTGTVLTDIFEGFGVANLTGIEFLNGAVQSNTSDITINWVDSYDHTGSGSCFAFRSGVEAKLYNCTGRNNQGSTAWGGGMVVYLSNVTGINCEFTNNEQTLGGGVAANDSTVLLVNCTLADNNSLTAGGGLHSNWSGVTVVNGVIYGNTSDGTDPQIYNTGTASLVSYSCIEGFAGTEGWDDGNNTANDPEFLGTGDNPYELSSSTPTTVSEGANTGHTNYPSEDLLNVTRVEGSMGAFEYISGDPPAAADDNSLLFGTGF